MKYNGNLLKFISLSIFLNINLFAYKDLKLKPVKSGPYGALSADFLRTLKDIFNVNTFIETGTFLGYSTKVAAEIFNNVFTIELSKEVYNKACENLKPYSNVKLYNGDSGIVLGSLLRAHWGNILVWLDGHYSGNYYGYNTAFGNGTTPVIDELISIKNSGLKDIIILIDDIRLFDKRLQGLSDLTLSNYPDFNQIFHLIKDINKDYKLVLMGEVLIAYLNSHDVAVSNLLEACTISRLGGSNINELLKYEQYIIKAKGIEKEEIKNLYLSCNIDAYVKLGIGDYYTFWYALTLINDKQYNQAKDIFRQLLFKGFEPQRMQHYVNYVDSLG